MNVFTAIILAIFIGINMCAFAIMVWDKMRAREHGRKRISEGILFFMSAACGSIGVLMGMLWLRHKTQKWYFVIGIPLLILQNVVLLYAIYFIVNEMIF